MCSDIRIEDANKRAQMHKRRTCPQVFIAQISTERLRQTHLQFPFSNGTKCLLAWTDEEGTVMFISTSDLRYYMGVDYRISQ